MGRMRGPAFVIGLVLVALFAFLPPAMAQMTTGRIEGKVLDSTGGALPGATVTVSGPALQGVRTVVTDGTGAYRFPTLPPGKYTVKAELAGMKTTEQQNITVGLDRTVNVDFSLTVGNITENVTVQGQAQVIDVTSTATGLNANTDFFNRLPSRRDFYAVAQFAPTTATDASGTTFAGSTGAENSYIIEGLNTTGIQYSQTGKTLNQDFIEEVEVITGALPAEYGRMTGGVINVVTKSGSNQYHGSLFGFAEGGPLQADDSTRSLRPTWVTTVRNTAHLWDVGGSVGGYAKKDRVWFFAAYNPQQRKEETLVIQPLSAVGSPALNSSVPRTTNTNLFSAKATVKLANNHNLVFSDFADPAKMTGNVFAIAGPSSTWDGTNETGGNDAVLRYDGIFTPTSFLRAQYAWHREKSTFGGAGRDIAQTINARVTPNINTGGFGYWDDTHFGRDVLKADFTKVLPYNEIKAGFDYENISSDVDRFQGGAGQRMYLMHTLVNGTYLNYVRHRFYLNDLAPGFVRGDPTTWSIALPLSVHPAIKNYSFYGQDSLKFGHLSLNLGLRWEQQKMLDRNGVTAANLKKNWAPRLGAIYDPTGDGKTKLYFNWGRFYEAIPMDMGIRAFGGELTAFMYNFSTDPTALAPDSAVQAQGGPRSSILGSSVEPVDPNLRGQYVDEAIVGFEREVGPNFTVGVRYAHRKLGNVIEDFLIPAPVGEYFIANPGTGLGADMAFYDGTPVTAPPAQRTYNGVELTARKRYSNGWQVMGSYVWSKLEGNYDGTFQASTGQLDPNINSAYDYADFLVNAQGFLSNDRRHAFKFNGTYEFQNGPLKKLSLGGSTFIASGFPLTAYGYSIAYQNWEYYLTPRGSLGRAPWTWEGDVHVSYPFALGQGKRLEAIMDVFNVFNRQAITQYDQRFNLIADGTCAGIPAGGCNGDGGLATNETNIIPLTSVTRAMATNPDFLVKGTNFTPQRSIRLGVRITF